MTREAYLQELRLRLSHRLTEPELERMMRYYEDYFSEAGPEGEQRVIEELGPPERLVRRIMGEQVVEELDQPGQRPRTGLRSVWMVVLAVCAAPVALPLAFGLVMVAAALVLVAVTLVAGFGFAGLVCIVYGGAAAMAGFASLLTHGLATALYFMGGGAVMAGIGLLLVAAALGISGLCFRGIVRLLSRGLRRGEAYA